MSGVDVRYAVCVKQCGATGLVMSEQTLNQTILSVKWPQRERLILHDIIYMWNLGGKKFKLIETGARDVVSRAEPGHREASAKAHNSVVTGM